MYTSYDRPCNHHKVNSNRQGSVYRAEARDDMQRERVIDRDLHRVTEFSSIANFKKANEVPAGISTIQSGGVPIDLLVSPAASSTTICFFHGAIESHFTLPALSGLGISGGIEANRVFISDPSLVLDEELMLSWYAGNRYQPELQKSLTTILEKVITSLGSERVVFFGGSGGGFASLYFAHHFENSLALVFNPQTKIDKYSLKAVHEFVERAFHVEVGDSHPLSELPNTVVHDLCNLYERPTGAKVAYMQNLNDQEHIHSHLLPFLTAVHPETEVLLLADHWREGHFPPPKDLLSQVLDASASSVEWAGSFTNLGFKNTDGIDFYTAEALTNFVASEGEPEK